MCGARIMVYSCRVLSEFSGSVQQLGGGDLLSLVAVLHSRVK